MIKFNDSKKFITQPDMMNYGVWYQCTSRWYGDKPFLVRRVGNNLFFIIYNDGSTNCISGNSVVIGSGLIATEVEVEINVL